MRQSSTFLGFLILLAAALLILFGASTIRPQKTRTVSPDSAGNLEKTTALERPSVDFGNPSQGSLTAPTTIVGYSDYSCAACATLNETMRQLVVEDPDAVRYVWKDYPLSSADSTVAAIAARCAERQGMFWEYHDLLFTMNGAIGTDNLTLIAEGIGLDMNDFTACLDSRDTIALIERDMVEGQRLQINSVPYLFVGSRRVEGALTLDQLKRVVESERNSAVRNAAQSGVQ